MKKRQLKKFHDKKTCGGADTGCWDLDTRRGRGQSKQRQLERVVLGRPRATTGQKRV